MGFVFAQFKQGKEVVCNISRLPQGSVIFEDVDFTIYKGQVLKYSTGTTSYANRTTIRYREELDIGPPIIRR